MLVEFIRTEYKLKIKNKLSIWYKITIKLIIIKFYWF